MRKLVLIALLTIFSTFAFSDRVPFNYIYVQDYVRSNNTNDYQALTNVLDRVGTKECTLVLPDRLIQFPQHVTNVIPANVNLFIQPRTILGLPDYAWVGLQGQWLYRDDHQFWTNINYISGVTGLIANAFSPGLGTNISISNGGDIDLGDVTVTNLTVGNNLIVSNDMTFADGIGTTLVVDNTLTVSNIDLTPQNSITLNYTTADTVQDIQDDIDALKKFIPPSETVELIFAAGTYSWTNSLTIGYFYGGGNFNITGDGYASTNVARIDQSTIFDCSSGPAAGEMISSFDNEMNLIVRSIRFSNLPDGAGGDQTHAIFVSRSTYALVYDCSFQAPTNIASTGVYMFNTPVSNVEEAKFTGLTYGVRAGESTVMFCQNITNITAQPSYGQYAHGGATIGIGTSSAGAKVPLQGCTGSTADDREVGGGKVRRE